MSQGGRDVLVSDVMQREPVSPGKPCPVQRPETMRVYAAEWLAFVAWCRVAGCTPLPAAADTLAAYLIAASPGAARGTVGRKRAAIRAMHRQHGLPLPALDKPARSAVRQAASPSTSAARSPRVDLTKLAVRCPRDIAGLRDRALLLLVACRVATIEDLLGLEREQVRFIEAGAEMRLPHLSPAVALIARGNPASCPVRALEDWLEASDTSFGPIFRKIDRWGNVEHARLGPDGLRRIVARRCKAG